MPFNKRYKTKELPKLDNSFAILRNYEFLIQNS